MFRDIFRVGFYETDALGHVNNTRLPQWFERSRDPLFDLFNPEKSLHNPHLILARMEVEYKREIYYGAEVEIRTGVRRVGTKSFVVYQEAWQNNQCCAFGESVLVHYDYPTKATLPLTDAQRAMLEEHQFGPKG